MVECIKDISESRLKDFQVGRDYFTCNKCIQNIDVESLSIPSRTEKDGEIERSGIESLNEGTSSTAGEIVPELLAIEYIDGSNYKDILPENQTQKNDENAHEDEEPNRIGIGEITRENEKV